MAARRSAGGEQLLQRPVLVEVGRRRRRPSCAAAASPSGRSRRPGARPRWRRPCGRAAWTAAMSTRSAARSVWSEARVTRIVAAVDDQTDLGLARGAPLGRDQHGALGDQLGRQRVEGGDARAARRRRARPARRCAPTPTARSRPVKPATTATSGVAHDLVAAGLDCETAANGPRSPRRRVDHRSLRTGTAVAAARRRAGPAPRSGAARLTHTPHRNPRSLDPLRSG